MRTADMLRKTRETEVFVSMNLDGQGDYRIQTGLPFFNHMLELFSRHSHIDLEIRAQGDTQIDPHHTVEDVGIVMGQVFLQAVGDKRMINRYGSAVVPMDEALSLAAVDISNRPYCVYEVNLPRDKVGDFDSEVVREFFQAFCANARVNLHVRSTAGENTHHILESVFKACAVAFRQALTVSELNREIPSTKDVL